MKLNKIHHVAVICSDYEKSKHFYTDVLGMKIVNNLSFTTELPSIMFLI